MYDSMYNPGAYQVILFSPSGWAEPQAGQHIHIDCLICCRWGISRAMRDMAVHPKGSCLMVGGVTVAGVTVAGVTVAGVTDTDR